MSEEINLKPEVIIALIETSGFEKEEVAKKARISLKSLEAGKLTVAQIKRLAQVLKRPVAAFFSDEITPLPATPDYRLNREKRINPEVYLAQRKLIYLREKLKELGAENTVIPSFEPGLSPFQQANAFRDYLKVDVLKNQKPGDILKHYKKVLEDRLNLLIIEYPLKPEGLEATDDVRAFSIYSEISGVVLNETDNPSVKLFSLFHEVCHLLRRTSGICSLEYGVEERYEEETFCNQFAAEFLVPSSDLREELKNYTLAGETILEDAGHLSKIYGVSKQVILLRLLYLGVLSREKYYSLKQELESTEIKKQGGYRNWEEVFKNRTGNLTIRTVRRKLQENRLSFYEALTILDVKTNYAEKFLYE